MTHAVTLPEPRPPPHVGGGRVLPGGGTARSASHEERAVAHDHPDQDDELAFQLQLDLGHREGAIHARCRNPAAGDVKVVDAHVRVTGQLHRRDADPTRGIPVTLEVLTDDVPSYELGLVLAENGPFDITVNVQLPVPTCGVYEVSVQIGGDDLGRVAFPF